MVTICNHGSLGTALFVKIPEIKFSLSRKFKQTQRTNPTQNPQKSFLLAPKLLWKETKYSKVATIDNTAKLLHSISGDIVPMPVN